MSKVALANTYVSQYLRKEIDRRTFFKLLLGLGVSTVAASVLAASFEARAAGAKGKPLGKPPL
jgi:hypothetical protein